MLNVVVALQVALVVLGLLLYRAIVPLLREGKRANTQALLVRRGETLRAALETARALVTDLAGRVGAWPGVQPPAPSSRLRFEGAVDETASLCAEVIRELRGLLDRVPAAPSSAPPAPEPGSGAGGQGGARLREASPTVPAKPGLLEGAAGEHELPRAVGDDDEDDTHDEETRVVKNPLAAAEAARAAEAAGGRR